MSAVTGQDWARRKYEIEDDSFAIEVAEEFVRSDPLTELVEEEEEEAEEVEVSIKCESDLDDIFCMESFLEDDIGAKSDSLDMK